MPRPTSLSLERKLPLLISTLLVALAVGLTVAGYREVRRASELRAIERLQRFSTQLAEFAGMTAAQRIESVQRAASDSTVRAHLAADDATVAGDDHRNAVVEALRRTLSHDPPDTSVIAEVRSVAEARTLGTRPELEDDEAPIAALIATLANGRPAVGDLYPRGDSVYYWVGAPVTDNGRILGHVVQRRVFVSSMRTQQRLRDLTGNDSVSIYAASDGGQVWATFDGRPLAPPDLHALHNDGPNVIRYSRPSGGEYVGVYAPVANTPLRLIAEVPYRTLLERPRTFLRRSIAVAAAMLVIGILTAWVASRRITRPLRDLTQAADAISTGNYAYRAPVGRRDETGRLAEAFNTMAAQVQRSHDDLERQIEASRTLAARLSEANRAKSDFLATMSHELRTPLNAIGGYIDLIGLGIRGPVTDEQRHDLERMRYNQRHLLTIIGNILDFARLDARKLTYHIGDVRVDQVVNDVASSVAPLLDEKQLRLEFVGCDRAVVARADRGRLEQILLNLLSNSVRFTPSGGLITVTLAATADRVEVVVTDTGIGIPRDKLDAIFEPFVQVESGLTRTVGGTGLGLTISRALARAMDGDLTGDSDGATGARFTLTLPAGRPAPHEARDVTVATTG